MAAVIETQDLVKVYGDKVRAVDGVSFAVEEGEFFGFLGPNGAGKTTTIKILITLLQQTSGAARVLGYDVRKDAAEIRLRMGYAAQGVGVDDDLTGRENLMLQGRLYHMGSQELHRRVDELLDLMDLTGDAHRPAGSYSGGMRKRLDLATGLVHQPQVLFLDEPTTGLDPQNRANLWTYLERLNRQEGLTIFLTTHYMEEADLLCHRLAIIDHGHIVALGSPAALKEELGAEVISLTLKRNGASPDGGRERAKDLLADLPGVSHIDVSEEGVNVYGREGGALVPLVLSRLNDSGIVVTNLGLTQPTLNDVFLKYTGRRIRDEVDSNWRSRSFMMMRPGGRRGPRF